jgi:hypothetical protein
VILVKRLWRPGEAVEILFESGDIIEGGAVVSGIK